MRKPILHLVIGSTRDIFATDLEVFQSRILCPSHLTVGLLHGHRGPEHVIQTWNMTESQVCFLPTKQRSSLNEINGFFWKKLQPLVCFHSAIFSNNRSW